MYKAFYGFRQKPFLLTPDPEGLFLSPTYKRALTYLEYGFLESASIILLTGEVGTGKTTLINHVRRRNADHLQTVLITNTNVTPDELLELILRGFGIEEQPASKPQALEMLRHHFARLDDESRNGLLIIDDAQNLSIDALEEIRMLFSLEKEPHAGLQVFLVGQPELRERLLAPQLTSLAQRVGVNYHLPPLAPKEVAEYIEHRVQHVGGSKGLFNPKALSKITAATGGIPRSINQLCDAALVFGYGYNQKTIGATIIQQVIADRGGFGLVDAAKPASPHLNPSSNRPSAASSDDFQAMDGRLQALERSIVKLTSHLGKDASPAPASADASTEMNNRLMLMKQQLAKEKRKRAELTKELSALRSQLAECQPQTVPQEPRSTEKRFRKVSGEAQIHRFKL